MVATASGPDLVHPIVLDCDPGYDDAAALVLAQGSPSIELLAVTTIGGNQVLEKVTRNALGLATVLGITAPVAAGCAGPLLAELAPPGRIHGETGLDGVTLPEPSVELDPRHAVDVVIDAVMSRPAGTVTLVPTGPLTNIALAVIREPAVVERCRGVVLMGGACHTGNAGPYAEFNIATDPEAAHVVLSAGWEVTMVGLDLTHQALATDDVVARVAGMHGPAARLLGEVFAAYGASYRVNRGFDHPPLHDPCAVAHVIAPEVVRARPVPVAVELTGTLTRGMTVADFRYPAPPECRTQVALELDRPAFWDLMMDAVERLDGRDPRPSASVGHAGV